MSAQQITGTLTSGGVGVNNATGASVNLALGFGGDPTVEISVHGAFPACSLSVTVSDDGGITYYPCLVVDQTLAVSLSPQTAVSNFPGYLSSPIALAASDTRLFYVNTVNITNVNVTATNSSGGVIVNLKSSTVTTSITNALAGLQLLELARIRKGIGILVDEDLATL